MDFLNQTIASAHLGLERGDFSSVELTQAYLKQIHGLNATFNAYLTVLDESALEAAKQSDVRRAADQSLGSLDGIPLAVKDNILIQNTRTTAGSKILENYIAPNDATVIRKLRDGGAVFLGKTNMDEFALGSSTENSAYGPTKHPRDLDRVPGGTSGGSACAVAADLCVAALGSDTGGSIRQPAAFCGIIGLKPTYGRVSRSGLMAAASSFDQIGSLTKTVKDAEILFSAIHGCDPLDQTTAPNQPFRMDYPKKIDGLRIGLPKQAWGEGMTDGVRTHVMEGIKILEALGAQIVEVSLPYMDEALAVYYVLNFCEVSANLSRFDGMRFGLREKAASLMETYMQSRTQGFGPEVRRRIMLGTYALSKGYYDAYYRQARKVRTLIHRAYAEVFKTVDVLITPTAPSTAFKIGEKISDPLTLYLEDIFTVGVNVVGIPALSISCGDHEGLPVGMQIMGKMFDEGKILDIAYAFEQATKI
ncbi:Asp-tRNA(Asn)/Glu-tRNA(Gln) amidotransferase subunit GatA [Candidatus Uhrbacteria bacterium]|nr:Asp-tRNA(Asn)/Glu-tRNA(Gln) amidotransferase subunit GatA [Candidatus Uhrbacteria bacterium]